MGAIPILAIAALQGWLLYGLHDSIEHKTWPATQPGWLLALYAVALLVPTALQLLADRLRERPAWLLACVIALLVGGLGGYAGWTFESINDRNFNFFSLPVLYGALFAAWFIALPFAQARLKRGTWEVSYPDLFELAWQNALVLCEAALFTGVFWLLLVLWAALFKVIDVAFFAELFEKPVFIYPVSSIAFGYAIHLIESNEKIVVTLRRHLLGVFSWLLPLVAFIAVLFLLTLSFTGLQPLWRTGHATSLMLWLQFLFIYFLNSAYQDGQAEPRYPSWLKLVLRIAVLSLPIYAGLCAYSLGLRVEQHGWTVSRVWAAIGTFLAALYGLGYAAAALRRSAWMAGLARINIGMALMVAAALLLAVGPVLDPRRLSSESQAQRVRSGSVLASKFDYDYLRFELGRYGREALGELAKSSNDEVARLAAASLAKTGRYQSPAPVAPQAVASRMELLPAGTPLDPALIKYLEGAMQARPHDHPHCLRMLTPQPCVMLALDLNADGQAEILTLSSYPLAVYGKVGGQWKKVGNLTTHGYDRVGPEARIRQGRVKTERRVWDDIVLGEVRYSVQPMR